MSYKILSSEVRGDILVTVVQLDCAKEPIEIPHFMPKSTDEVIENLDNRELTEQSKISAEVLNEKIKKDVDSVIGLDSAGIKTVLNFKG